MSLLELHFFRLANLPVATYNELCEIRDASHEWGFFGVEAFAQRRLDIRDRNFSHLGVIDIEEVRIIKMDRAKEKKKKNWKNLRKRPPGTIYTRWDWKRQAFVPRLPLPPRPKEEDGKSSGSSGH